ncbi:MAG: DUF4340 domain-containing protein [Gammaproteobacteria bacterium]|nr:DUF4340 domain-containing protein [Gammaproteobacteria bacterium]
MNARIGLLGGLLAAQVAIIAGLLLASGVGTDASAPQLLSFDPAKVTKLRVSGDEGAVQLTRNGEDWRLAPGSGQEAADGLPADGGKVSELLADLSDLDAPWPVATSDDSAERFEVTEDSHQRRLVIEDEDGPMADLLLGTSPGYRRVHARVSGQNDVYSIDFSNFEAPTDADQWLDKALLSARGEVSSVVLEDAWRLDSPDGEWRIDDAPADAEAANDLVRRFTSLQVLGMADQEDEADGEGGAVSEPAGVFLVTDADGEHRLALFHEAEEDDYSLTSNRVPGRFELATYIAEQMLADPADLRSEDGANGAADATDEPAEDAAGAQENRLEEGSAADQEG